MPTPRTTALPAPDPAVLRRSLDGRRRDVREQARRELDPAWFSAPVAPDPVTHRALVRERMALLAATGRPQSGFTAEHGGADDVGGSVTWFEMLGYGDLSLMVKAGVQWGLFGGTLQALGTEEHHRRYLRAVMDLELPGCFAMTETGHGSDVQRLATTATYDVATQEFVVHTPDEAAVKDYIGGAAQDARMAVVFAQLVTPAGGHGVHALLVPLRDTGGRLLPGVTATDCGPKGGLGGVDNGRLSFDQVRVPREALLDRYASVAPDGTYTSPVADPTRRFFQMVGALVRGRVSIAGGAGSATRSALAVAVRYAERRRQFQVPGSDRSDQEVALLDHAAHRRRLLPPLARSYVLGAAQEELVADLHAVQTGTAHGADAQRRLETTAAAVKVAATWHATATIQTCREACGGAGYLAENRLTALRGDTDVFTTFEGDNTVLSQLVSRGLLTRRRDALAASRAERVRHGLRRAAARVRRRLPVPVAGADVVSDPATALALLRSREAELVDGLLERLRRAGARGEGAAEAAEAQGVMLRLAGAHADRLAAEAFAGVVERCPDPATARVLQAVGQLAVLAALEADATWFLEAGLLRPATTRTISAAVDDLCRRLRPHASALVAGFGIPDGWLAAPIAVGGAAAADRAPDGSGVVAGAALVTAA